MEFDLSLDLIPGSLPESPPIGSGALRSPRDPDDFIYEHLAQGPPPGYYYSEFPEEYDLRKHAQESRDQGARGTCAAFTAAAIKEIQENIDCGLNEFMSPEFIYYHRDNKPASGMYGRNVFQILQRVGSVPESCFPYRDAESAEKPPEELYQLAARFKIANFAQVTTEEGLKRALLECGPCYLQLPLYSKRPHFWKQIGNEVCRGGHAVAVVGFTKEGFILKNSWGPNWNGDGHVIFPYEDWAHRWECWVAIDEKTGKLSESMKLGSFSAPCLTNAPPAQNTIESPSTKRRSRSSCDLM